MKIYPALILSGGLATRMRPITEKIPKALIEVAGKPFVYHQLDYLKAQGINEVVLSIGYLGEMVESFVGDGSAFGLKIRYSYDGEKLLGTGGAVKKALSLLEENFFLLYGDSFLPINYLQVQESYLELSKPALMTVLKNSNEWDASNVVFDEGVLIEYNKMHPRDEMKYIDFGLSVLNASVFSDYELGSAFDLADVYAKLSLRNELAGLEVFERFYEIGSAKGLAETESYFSKLMQEGI
jgi:NDP-sugar pyrophosphorylase family protein